MLRFLVVFLLLVPALARADEKAKGSDAPAIWPPPPDDDGPKKPAPKDKKRSKDAKERDAGSESDDAPLPRLSEDDDVPHTAVVAPEPPENPCDAPFDECRENCTIDHTNDDTTKVGGGKPLVTCMKRCTKAHQSCEERLKLGLQEQRRDDSPP